MNVAGGFERVRVGWGTTKERNESIKALYTPSGSKKRKAAAHQKPKNYNIYATNKNKHENKAKGTTSEIESNQ